jgi:hypothetical protein
MDPAFLAALPADIFQEVVRDHQRQQELTRRVGTIVSSTNPVVCSSKRQQVAAHRHFTMPHFFGAGGRIGARAHHHQQAPQPQMPTTISTDRAVQLFDRESICTLLLLYFLDQDKFNIARLQVNCESIGQQNMTNVCILEIAPQHLRPPRLMRLRHLGSALDFGWIGEV